MLIMWEHKTCFKMPNLYLLLSNLTEQHFITIYQINATIMSGIGIVIKAFCTVERNIKFLCCLHSFPEA